MRSLEANGGIFFHADSGNGLKHNFEACLKRFQRTYRAQILCEELKLKKIQPLHYQPPGHRSTFFHSRPFEAALSFKCLFELVPEGL